MNSEKKQEFTRRISQANSTQMCVILYDMALEYIEDAQVSEKKQDYEAFDFAISRIQGCISELGMSLNYNYEPAIQMRALYDYSLRRIGSSQAKRDSAILDEVKKIITPLRDSYDKISDQNTSGPVMGNSQEVYAGLTYGKSDVNENYVSQGNRGFLA